MRFFALLKKELHEALPWAILAAIILIVFGSLVLRVESESSHLKYQYQTYKPTQPVEMYWLRHSSNIGSAGVILLLVSVGLGLSLAVRQFWVANFSRTWGFELHRSVNRWTVVFSKLTVAVMCFISAPLMIWIFFYQHSIRPGVFIVPPPSRNFVEGCLFVLIGFAAYLGCALCGLSRAKWYTTKMAGLAFTFLIFLSVMFQWQIAWAVALLIFGITVLLIQLINSFLEREF